MSIPCTLASHASASSPNRFANQPMWFESWFAVLREFSFTMRLRTCPIHHMYCLHVLTEIPFLPYQVMKHPLCDNTTTRREPTPRGSEGSTCTPAHSAHAGTRTRSSFVSLTHPATTYGSICYQPCVGQSPSSASPRADVPICLFRGSSSSDRRINAIARTERDTSRSSRAGVASSEIETN